MKNLLILLCLLTVSRFVWSQEDNVNTIRAQVDSILVKVDKEEDLNKRADLILTIYDVQIEEYPLLLLETFQKLLQIAEKNHDILAESKAYSMAGQAYRLLGNHIKGLEYHHKAIRLAEKIENKSVLGWAQNEMAHIYKDREENQKAIALYKASIKNNVLGNNNEGTIWPIGNLAGVYMNMNQLDSSLYYSNLSLSRKSFLNDADQSYIQTMIAGVYSKMGDEKKAMEFFKMALQETNSGAANRMASTVYLTVADHYFRYQKIDSSILYAKKAIEVIQNGPFKHNLIKPAKLLMDIYQNRNADSTIKYLKIYQTANDSLYNTRANQQLQMMTFEEEQRQRDAATEKINYQNKIKTNLMLVGLAAFSLIALILYRSNLQRKKANTLLQQQKDKVESTLEELKSTQTQLIQSEKMASLGELTAGIAHEIQNPLNFVNNFSEVNSELIRDLKSEIERGNYTEANSIINNLESNEEKIVSHGKRADAIVKSMLQHSRTSSGQKELTDINALCDEYLRLSYHGYRAKNKSFNAKFETEFDLSLPKINVVPQDIGRVMLNLINNAFYAANEKFKVEGDKFEPQVIVSTKNHADNIEISVKDNGNGIPYSIKEKIFQPFFTTKPTGQGTGLGLSLSYDIVKAHGGEIQVESSEGNSTEFIITLTTS